MSWLKNVFGVSKPVIAMRHLEAMKAEGMQSARLLAIGGGC